ncbi:hypothetical protein CCAX7_24560 [Capsulimonas corticalis]|uniref:Uncharacterized protein n=1 Tax=Capsulimonas corticalis TaxID=2219043 RepID=A0A402CVH2_9BACT|nr:substrate-binding domain-containing protein [Capsulimonas corticalis]BDI30405.1 hypothetical protein CCAX7_24560 [Capsulimonas corticalis]
MRERSIYIGIVVMLLAAFAIGGWRSRHASTLSGVGEDVVNLTLLTTEDKASWVRAEVYGFNYENSKKYHVTFAYADARSAMQSILNGGSKPVLWSPDNPMWVAQASNAWRERRGTPLVDLQDPSSYRVFLRTPVVFLTTRDKAPYLREKLGGGDPWRSVYDLSMGRREAPWGSVHFAHADPLVSNAGMLTLGMMLNEYARESHGSGDMVQTASRPEFGAYLSDLERGLKYDPSCAAGSYALVEDYLKNANGRDFITAYESVALGAAAKTPNLAVVYPNPTLEAQQSMCVLSAPWVTPAQRAGAQAFMAYVRRDQALRDGLKYNMRPDTASEDLSLAPKLRAHAAQGFQVNYSAEDVPPYGALNIAAAQWGSHARTASR